jgi:hypothetical protein
MRLSFDMTTTPSSGNSFLQAHIEQNKTLVKTMVIKSGVSADLLNQRLIALYGESAVDLSTPTSWKYYMNISGEYHPRDTPMTVTSLDTLEEIAFTKENLDVHLATREAYQYGTRYFYKLKSLFPEQGQLIMGIVNPVDINTAIAAEEGTILTYRPDLVEPQESTLIPDLEAFIKNYLYRWNNQAFGISDSLYNTTYHAQLYLNVVQKLLALRLKRCKTIEAHSFHIRMHLASHHKLDKYMPYMNLKQTKWLYRNVAYLERNAGTEENFNVLMENILSARQIPVESYTLRQLNTFDTNYQPDVVARRTPLNSQYNAGENTYVEIEDLLKKEEGQAYGNTKYISDNKEDIVQEIKTSPSSVIATKILESNMIDYNDAVPEPLDYVLTRQWVSMAAKGQYNVAVAFKDPKTSEMYSLLAKDALIYYWYVLLHSNGIVVDTIPVYHNKHQLRNPKPSIDALVWCTDGRFTDRREIAKNMWDNMPAVSEAFSTKAFFDQSNKVFEETRRHWFMMGSAGDMDLRAVVARMSMQFFEDELIELSDSNQSISSWLAQNNLPAYDFSYDQAQELMNNIFVAATGYALDDTKRLVNIQRMMMSLMQDLSSYSIQFISEINDSDIRLINEPPISVGNVTGESDYNQRVDTGIRTYIEASEEFGAFVDVGTEGLSSCGIGTVLDPVFVSLAESYVMSIEIVRDVPVSLGADGITATYDGQNLAVSGNSTYLFEEFFLALTDEQKSQLSSLY